MIGIQHFLTVSAVLFVMGVLGIFINRKNVIIILMAIELILLVALIGAIVLTHRARSGVRPQNISEQVKRRPQDATRNANPGVGQGMEL